MFSRIAVFLLALVCPISAFAQANGKLQIHYMDVGQGDGAVLISPLGEVVLFDDGVLNQCGKPIGYLQSVGVTKIDYHIASHYHSDHVGCAASVLQMFPLQKAAYDRGGSYTTATYTAYVNAVGSKRVTAQKGQTITLDAGSATPVTITFIALNANGISTSDENDLSLIAVVRFGQFDAEFGGDLSGAGTGTVDSDPATPAPAPAPPAPSCSYTVSPQGTSVPASAGSFSVSVTTTAGCAWATTTNATWLSVSSGASGTGSGTAVLAYGANSGSARSGTATVAGQPVSVSQAAAVTTPAPAPTPTGPNTCARPSNASASNTAVCKDGTFSSSQNRSGTCSSHGGVSCWICPGVLCSGLLASDAALLYTPVAGPVFDAYADVETSTATMVGPVEVYKVHHHGSKTSSNATWLAVTTPKVGILSMSNANSYGHPTAEVLGRLHASSVKTYWTSVGNGAPPASGQDFVTTNGSIVVEAGPGASTFTVRYGTATDTYSVWGAASPAPAPAPPANGPLGSFDTPSDGAAGMTGAIAITGWALDDTGVSKVDIQRDAHPNDPLGAVVNGRVFVGSAGFVTGARPDLAGLYPAFPNATRAGWGYLMLSRGLIWDGQGAFNLYAVATDTQGNTTTLGSKRITVTNAAATKPFGNIDTPSQGATVSGTLVNFGWVLPLAGRTVPAANVQVGIDGVLLPQVSECLTNRADISQGFPSFDTSQAIRCFIIDTTRFSNGLHTIGWIVTDSTGQADGIGSRFFTIANPSITTTSGSDVEKK